MVPGKGRVKISVFLFPVVALLAATILSFTDGAGFTAWMKTSNGWILGNFGWLFSGGGMLFFLTCAAVFISPAGRIKIGGANAVPMLSKWHWFSVTLCTTIAIGILFWAGAEPLYHMHEPPSPVQAEDAQSFSMSTMYLHWTLLPYSMYTLAGLMFAVAFYNKALPFSVHSMLFPLKRLHLRIPGGLVNAICLYSLIAGMAASLSAGLLTMAGGAGVLTGAKTTPLLLGLVAVVIVGAFIWSAVSGILKGIRYLSLINTLLFVVFLVFIAATGPTEKIARISADGLETFGRTFFRNGLGLGLEQQWLEDWTYFYWSNWLAWTPVTALFLGRISVGYSIRMFIGMNLLLPSLFSAVWMSILGGFSLQTDAATGGALWANLQSNGVEWVMYGLLQQLPAANISGGLFLITAFVSFVTAADSNTSAMSSLCMHEGTADGVESPTWLKITWGLLLGAFSWALTAYAGIDGIRLSSVLGGFPVLLLMLMVMLGAWRWIWQHRNG